MQIRRRGFTALSVAAVVVLIMLLTGVASCSSMTNNNGKSDADVAQLWGSIYIGMSESGVRSTLGQPNSTQDMNTSGYRNVCWYYGSGNSYQLCFSNGILPPHHALAVDSKNHY